MLRKLSVICFLFFMISCENEKNTELTPVEKKMVDSLYNKNIDSLMKNTQHNCDSIHDEYYKSAIDSLKKRRLTEIQELFK